MLVKISDINLYYQISGSGEPLILLHGNGEDSFIFEKQIEYFSKKYQVIAIDTRAHGQTERGAKPFTFDTFADDVIGLMDSLQIEKAHILGFSDGGNTALHIALKYPQRIKSLILVGANLFLSGMKFTIRTIISLNYLWLCVSSLFNQEIKQKKEIWSLMVFQPQLSFRQISAIQNPTLILVGEHDMIKESHSRKMAAAMPNAQLQILSDANHFLLFEQTERANGLIDNFLCLQ